MNQRKVVIWGIGNDYEAILNQLKFEICKNNIILMWTQSSFSY